MYKLVIFDWDGTLMDSQAKIVSCMQTAAKICNIAIPSEDQVKHIIGISLLPAIKTLFHLDNSDSNQSKAIEIRDAYKQVFVDMDQTPSPMFSGATEMLESLHNKGNSLAVATGKARRGLERAWKQSNTKQFFIDSRCADEAESKPSPDMLKQLLNEHKLQPSEAVMIGDTTYDMRMAETIGMDRIAVSYGVHDASLLSNHAPKVIVHSIDELHQSLNTYLG